LNHCIDGRNQGIHKSSRRGKKGASIRSRHKWGPFLPHIAQHTRRPPIICGIGPRGMEKERHNVPYHSSSSKEKGARWWRQWQFKSNKGVSRTKNSREGWGYGRKEAASWGGSAEAKHRHGEKEIGPGARDKKIGKGETHPDANKNESRGTPGNRSWLLAGACGRIPIETKQKKTPGIRGGGSIKEIRITPRRPR